MGRTRLRLVLALALPFAISGVADAAPSGGALPPAAFEEIQVAGEHGVPDDAEMVVANITAVNPAEPGHITVFPCDEEVPATSNINYVADAIAPNLTLTRISASGTICIATFAVSDVIVDVVGYVPAESGISALANPVRFLDSRDDSPAPIPGGSTTEIPITGRSGVDPDADVVLFNLTVVGFAGPGHLTAFPCGEDLPETSSINHAPNQVVANMVTSRIGDNGSVCVYNLAPAEIIVDVAASATSGITPLPNPARVVDTRTTDTPIAARGTLTLDIGGRTHVPAAATAVVYNLTSVGSTGPGFATSYPCDIDLPVVSNLNHAAGQVAANSAITKLSADGELCIYTLAETHLIVDLIGYTEGTDDYIAVDPVRILDSREGWQPTCDWVLVDFGARHATLANIATRELRRLDFERASATRVEPIVDDGCRGVHRFVDDIAPSGIQSVRLDATQSFTPVSIDVVSLGIRRIHSIDDRILASNDRAVVVDTATNEQIWVGVVGRDDVFDLAVAPNGRLVIVRFGTDHAELWDMEANKRLPFASRNVDSRFAFSPDGRYVVYAERNDYKTVIVLTIDGRFVDSVTMPRPSTLAGFDFVGNGSIVMCVGTRGLTRYDLFTDLSEFDDFGEPTAASFVFEPSWAALTAVGTMIQTCTVR